MYRNNFEFHFEDNLCFIEVWFRYTDYAGVTEVNDTFVNLHVATSDLQYLDHLLTRLARHTQDHSMSSADLLQVWEAAKADPFYPSVSKNSQFAVGFVLLLIGIDTFALLLVYRVPNKSLAFILSGVFALNRSIVTLPALGIPASLAFG